MGIVIRPAKPEDAQELEDFLLEITSKNNKQLAQGYIKASFSEDFRKPSFIVACDGEEIIGSASISEEIFTVSTWGICWVGVREKYRNQGLGQKLVNACCEEIQRRYQKEGVVILRTYPDKTKLYEKCGFERAGQDMVGGWYMLKGLKASV